MGAQQPETGLRLERVGARRGSWGRLGIILTVFLAGSSAAIGVWLERRRSRRHLIRLSDHMLRDIGVSRGEAGVEAEKPFWRR